MPRFIREIVKAVFPLHGRKTPANEEAEAAVLSAVMLGNKRAMLEVLETGLKPEHFHNRSNLEIAKVVWDLAERSIPIDVQTIAEQLRKNVMSFEQGTAPHGETSMLQVVGGAAYLARIMDATPAVAHVSAHAKIVREKHRIRGVIEACEIIVGGALSDYGDAKDFFVDARRRLGAAIETGDGAMRSLVSASEAVASLREKLQDAWAGKREAFGLPLPWRRLNFALGGLRLGTVTFVAALEGEGKSAWVNQVVNHMAGRNYDGHPIGVLFWSGEMPTEEATQRAVLLEANVGSHCRPTDAGELRRVHVTNMEICSGKELDEQGEPRADLDGFKIARIDAAFATVRNKPIHFDDTSSIDMAGLRFLVRSVKERYAEEKCPRCRANDETRACTCTQLRLVAIDHFLLMSHRSSHNEGTSAEAYRETCVALKDLAKDEKVAVVVLTQYKDAAAQSNHAPNNGDLFGSSGIKQIADATIHIRRPWKRLADKQTLEAAKVRHHAEIHLPKMRNGREGVFPFWFEDDAIRFDERQEV